MEVGHLSDTFRICSDQHFQRRLLAPHLTIIAWFWCRWVFPISTSLTSFCSSSDRATSVGRFAIFGTEMWKMWWLLSTQAGSVMRDLRGMFGIRFICAQYSASGWNKKIHGKHQVLFAPSSVHRHQCIVVAASSSVHHHQGSPYPPKWMNLQNKSERGQGKGNFGSEKIVADFFLSVNLRKGGGDVFHWSCKASECL